MEKLFIISALIAGIFFLFKLLEMKYITKEWQPLKHVIRDSVYVFVSGVISLFLVLNMNGSVNDFMDVMTNTKGGDLKATQIFTDEPGF
jgi:putative effector of murein hydrolase LrgA (UPF0299 family)